MASSDMGLGIRVPTECTDCGTVLRHSWQVCRIFPLPGAFCIDCAKARGEKELEEFYSKKGEVTGEGNP